MRPPASKADPEDLQMQLAFIGAGKMATAIARGLIEQGVCSAENIVATDVLPAARTAFTEQTGAGCGEDNAVAVAAADVVILAVKPQVAADVMAPLHGAFDRALLISIAAGLPLDSLTGWAGSDRVVRVMPNTPAMVGMGAGVYAAAAAVTDDDRAMVSRIFGAVGIIHELPEEAIDAVTGLSGSGPAYVFEFVQALVEAGSDVGLPPDVAHALVVQTVAGAAEMLRRDLGSPDELRNAVTSPGGTTAAGLGVLADGEFRELIRRVVRRATERSIELGKE
jgi:pyrroline-5-carboxylate reductase